jgi:hypothetical protein
MMPYGNEEAYDEMDPMQKEAKVSALKDLISMMQDLIVKAGGDPEGSEEMPDEMPMAAEGESDEGGESALEELMETAEEGMGMGNGKDYRDFMRKGSQAKPKGKSMMVAMSVTKGKGSPKASSSSSKCKKSKMKRYG